MIARLRANGRRKIALVAIFGLVLSGTGLASLAQLVDTGRATFNASVTTIAFQIDGLEDVTYTFPAGLTPGEVHVQPMLLSNINGTGYVRVPVAVEPITGNSNALWNDTRVYVGQGINAPQCTSTNTGLLDAVDWTTDGSGGPTKPFKSISLSTPPWSEFQIDAGASNPMCVLVRLGTVGGSYTGSTAISWAYRMDAFYP